MIHCAAGDNGTITDRIKIETLHSKIRKCRRCLVDGFPITPPPLVLGNAPAPFMLVGQAPSISDSRSERMYTGPAGRKLLTWLVEAGFKSEDFGRDIYFTALTKCFPGRLPGKSTDRAPSALERLNCSGWLQQQIAVVSPAVIIPFGKMAIDVFIPTAPLNQVIGQQYNINGTVYLPLPHSSGASTWLNQSEHRELLAEAIAKLRTLRINMCTQGWNE